jgi:hypothetical protein
LQVEQELEHPLLVEQELEHPKPTEQELEHPKQMNTLDNTQASKEHVDFQCEPCWNTEHNDVQKNADFGSIQNKDDDVLQLEFADKSSTSCDARKTT